MPTRLKTLAAVPARAAVLVALACARAHACQPCPSELDLKGSLARAEAVVVAKRPEGAKPFDFGDNGPPCDELLVEAVLKGEVKGERLRVRSFYGMCPYGITLGEGAHVVLLARASPGDYEGHSLDPGGECKAALAEKEGFYVAVERGCAVKSLAVERGLIEAEGSKLTLEEFRDRYGLRAGAAAPTQNLFAAWPGARPLPGLGAGFFGRAGVPLPFEVTN